MFHSRIALKSYHTPSVDFKLGLMGIKQLFKFLSENAPRSIKVQTMDNYTGRILAVDASTCLYQFVVAIRLGAENQHANLMNDAGEVTSHIGGFLNRTLRMLEAGIKPVYVFDGKPPEFKSAELAERREKREKAEAELKEAVEAGDQEAVLKQTKRTVKVTPKMNEDTRRLLRMMGCPVIEAPCEAEATCAELTKLGKVYGAVTEDMDVLTFGSPIMIKNLFSTQPGGTTSGPATPGLKTGQKPVYEVNLATALEQLNVSMDQFIDFCILCGCDYADTLRGVGPHTGFKLVVEHGTLEEVIKHVEDAKVPPEWRFREARQLFKDPEVISSDAPELEFDWTMEPDYDGLRKFLIEENQFNVDRVEKNIERLKACKKAKTQMRLDSFFKSGGVNVKDNEKFDPFKKKDTAKRGSSVGASKANAKKFKR
jgi:flap endonuclease-1